MIPMRKLEKFLSRTPIAMNGELTYIQKVAMSKHKDVNEIQVNWDFVLASPYKGIMMGEADWLTNEELQLLEGESNMNYDVSGLPQFQAHLDEAVSIVFGRVASVTGVRFLMNNILVSFHFNEVDDSFLLPYECITRTAPFIVECIHQVITAKEEEIQKREKLREEYDEKHERDIYEHLRKKFEKVD